MLVQAIKARGGFNRMVDATARREAARHPAELVDGVRASAGAQRLAPGQTLRNADRAVARVEERWAAHLGDRRMSQLRDALTRLREITDPFDHG